MTSPKSNNGRMCASARISRRGFSLVEIAVATFVFTIVVALVLGMVVFQSRFGLSIGNYSEMNTLSKQVMTRFEQDMRQVISVDTAKPGELTVTLMDPTADAQSIIGKSAKTQQITYLYDSTSKTLTRENRTLGGGQLALLRNLEDCQFLYFNSIDAPVTSPTINNTTIKKVLVAATMRKSVTGGRSAKDVTTSDYLVSAIVTMRCRSN